MGKSCGLSLLIFTEKNPAIYPFFSGQTWGKHKNTAAGHLPAPPGRILQGNTLAKIILHNVRVFK
jgi:hypothetical protein